MVVEMSHSNSLPEIFSGDVDLGLGLGLRPGSLPDPPPVSSPNSPSIFDSVIAGDLFTWSHVDSLPSSGVTDHDRTLAAKESGQGAISARVSGMFGRISEKLRPKRSSIRKRNSDSVCNQHVWAAESSAELPSTGDSIPIGSSLRQQRILYEKDIGEILRRRQAECETRLFSKPGTLFPSRLRSIILVR